MQDLFVQGTESGKVSSNNCEAVFTSRPGRHWRGCKQKVWISERLDVGYANADCYTSTVEALLVTIETATCLKLT